MTQINLKNNIIRSERGKKKIAWEGYFYNYKEESKDRSVWRCNKRGCVCLLYTTKEFMLISVGHHNHVRDERMYQRVLLLDKAKELSTGSNEKARGFVLNSLKELNHPITSFDYAYLRDSVTKNRRKENFTLPPDYDIPDEFLYTKDGKPWL